MNKIFFLSAAAAALLASCSAVCPNCHGTGQQMVQSKGRMKAESCVTCNGRGQIDTITTGEAIRGFTKAATGALNLIH